MKPCVKAAVPASVSDGDRGRLASWGHLTRGTDTSWHFHNVPASSASACIYFMSLYSTLCTLQLFLFFPHWPKHLKTSGLFPELVTFHLLNCCPPPSWLEWIPKKHCFTTFARSEVSSCCVVVVQICFHLQTVMVAEKRPRKEKTTGGDLRQPPDL